VRRVADFSLFSNLKTRKKCTVKNIALMPNNRLLCATEGSKIVEWDWEQANIIPVIEADSLIKCISLSHDLTKMLVLDQEKEFSIWNRLTKKLETRVIFDYSIEKIQFSHNNEKIIILTDNPQRICIWDILNKTTAKLLNHDGVSSFENFTTFERLDDTMLITY
jgi:WD40 repeat protein